MKRSPDSWHEMTAAVVYNAAESTTLDRHRALLAEEADGTTTVVTTLKIIESARHWN